MRLWVFSRFNSPLSPFRSDFDLTKDDKDVAGVCGYRVWLPMPKMLFLRDLWGLAEGEALAANSLGGGLSRRARSCGKLGFWALPLPFARARPSETSSVPVDLVLNRILPRSAAPYCASHSVARGGPSPN